jgi:antibiotic biosynthesis monooxygenase (ABM) superfamily enzyme
MPLPRYKKFGFLNILINTPFYPDRIICVILNDLYIPSIKRSSISIILIVVTIIITILKSYITT